MYRGEKYWCDQIRERRDEEGVRERARRGERNIGERERKREENGERRTHFILIIE